MDQSSLEWFNKNKQILKELISSMLELLDLNKVDTHTLILSVVVVNQLYKSEDLKKYLDSINVPDVVSKFVESISQAELPNNNDEKTNIAASERKTLLDLCAHIFQSLEYDEEDNEYNESKCFYALRNMRGWQGEGPIIFD